MRVLRSVRLMLLALLVFAIPASSHATVFVSVGFAPPPLPVYVQPPCPEPGLMWVPGYWAYGPDGYYWVPGEWVPAPYVGALWTPGYWGWSTGLYIWHPGYWGRRVGYYGGVNYGFGYFGIGFVGGMWRGSVFSYNTAVWRVDRDRIRHTYYDRRDFNRYRVGRDSHVAYNGGPGGIRYAPNRDERAAEHQSRMGPTSFQTQRRDEAMRDRNAYFRNNRGRPHNLVGQRPLGRESRPAPQGGRQMNQPDQQRQRQEYRQQQQQQQEHRQQPQSRSRQEHRVQPQSPPRQEFRQQQYRSQQQFRQQQEHRSRQEYRPQERSHPQPHAENRGGSKDKAHGRGR